MMFAAKHSLTKAAASKPDWQNVCSAMVLALSTTIRACEIKSLRWHDVDMREKTLVVRTSKTQAGVRVNPLNDEAMLAFHALYSRAAAVDGAGPACYVFPARENGHINPASPQKSWRSA